MRAASGDLVLVHWHDAETSHGWTDADEADKDSSLALSVGFVLVWRKATSAGPELRICGDRDSVTLYPVNRRIGIPWQMIRRVEDRTGVALWKRGKPEHPAA